MRVGVAGTFGPIHDGHRRLFETALERGDEGVVVALTSDDLAQRTRHEPRPIPDFGTRRERVADELAALDRWDRAIDVRKLHSEHGIADSDPDLDAVVVSPETAPEIAAINEIRRERGLDPVEGIVVPFVRGDDGERISSTRIVAGEIDEHGRPRDDRSDG
jgi:pantetheine-phosphate adenylyltransferase